MIKDCFFIKHISKAIELKLILSRISTSAYETYETWRRKKEYSYESSITYPRIFPRYYYYNTRFPRLEDSLAIFSYAERKKYKSLMQIVSAINAWPGNLLFLLKIRGDSEGFAGSVSDTKERNRDFAWVSLNKPWDNRPKPFLSLLFPSYLSSQSSPLSLSFSLFLFICPSLLESDTDQPRCSGFRFLLTRDSRMKRGLLERHKLSWILSLHFTDTTRSRNDLKIIKFQNVKIPVEQIHY